MYVNSCSRLAPLVAFTSRIYFHSAKWTSFQSYFWQSSLRHMFREVAMKTPPVIYCFPYQLSTPGPAAVGTYT